MMKILTLQRSKKRTGFEYIKRSTIVAMEKMENEKIRCWKMTQKKNEMETGDENRNITV